MKKEITFNEITRMYRVFQTWDAYVKDIKLNPISLYRLIDLKRKIEICESAIEETIRTIFVNNGAAEEQGMLRLPNDKQEAVAKEIEDLGNQKEEIEFQKITIKEEDNIPVELFDILFDFVEIKE